MLNRHSLLGYVLILLAGSIWGMTFSLARLATESGAHPLGLTLWQGLGGGLVLLMLCLMRCRWPFEWRFSRHYFALGLIGTALPGALYFYAAPHVPAGILAITIATVPMLTYACAWLLRRELFVWSRLWGLVAGILAVSLLIAPDSLPDPAMAVWIIIVLFAALSYTAENIYVDSWIPKDTDMLALLCGMLLAASVLILPLVIAMDAFVTLRLPFGQTEWAVVAMALVSSIAYTLYLYTIQLSGPVFASQTGYVVTLAGVFWGIAIFQEQHSVWVWLALILMLIGLGLVTPRRKLLGLDSVN